MVIGLQADMFDPEAVAANAVSAYTPIIHKIATRAAAFRKPVLLLNGDSHVYEADHPFAAGQQASTFYGETTVAPNVTRVTVNGSTTAPHEWLKLRLDPTRQASSAGPGPLRDPAVAAFRSRGSELQVAVGKRGDLRFLLVD